MNDISNGKISQCHIALKKQGFCTSSIDLPEHLYSDVKSENFRNIDEIFKKLLRKNGELFNWLVQFTPYSIDHIEHIISLRDADNEWEEDGIWHDDGSRVLAFSLSLTIEKPEGGILEIRPKGATESYKIPTPDYGTIIVFKTGQDLFEHKINKVNKGKRLIIAGWLYK